MTDIEQSGADDTLQQRTLELLELLTTDGVTDDNFDALLATYREFKHHQTLAEITDPSDPFKQVAMFSVMSELRDRKMGMEQDVAYIINPRLRLIKAIADIAVESEEQLQAFRADRLDHELRDLLGDN